MSKASQQESKDIKLLMDSAWVKVQQRTFTRWMNAHLRKHKYPMIENAETDFETGFQLMKLINALYSTTIPKANKNPKMRPQKLDNCSIALAMVDAAGIKTHFLKPNHLVDHDLKMILGMIWAIILDYQIKGISVEELTAKEGLLLWCQRKTAGYKDVHVKDFSGSWRDGLALCALIHAHRPDLLDFDKLSKDNPEENIELAFKVAEEKLNIPRLLDVADLREDIPDERAVMTYVSEYFHCFASQNQFEKAGRQIGKILKMSQENEKLKEEYEASCKDLVDWAKKKTDELNDHDFGATLDDVKNKLTEFDSYKTEEKPPKIADKLAVEGKFSNLQVKLAMNGRPPYSPPDGLSLSDLDNTWEALEEAERNRLKALQDALAKQARLDALLRRFKAKTEKNDAYLDGKGKIIDVLENEKFDSLSQVQSRITAVEGLQSENELSKERLESQKKLGDLILSLDYKDPEFIKATITKLSGRWEKATDRLKKLRSRLDEELAKQKQIDDLRIAFAKKAKEFNRWLKDSGEFTKDHNFGDNLEDVEAYKAKMDSDEERLKSESAAKMAEVEELNKQLTGLGVTENPYTPLTLESLGGLRDNLNGLMDARRKAYAAKLEQEKANDAKRQEFAKLANAFAAYIDKLRSDIAAVSGSPQESIEAINGLYADGAEGESQLGKITSLDEEMKKDGVYGNKHTTYTAAGLKSRWHQLKTFVSNFLASLTEDIALEKKTADMRAEYEASQKKEAMKIDFAKKANAFNYWIENAEETLTEPLLVDSEADVAPFKDAYTKLKSETDSKVPELEELSSLSEELSNQGITENPFSTLSMEDITKEWDSLSGHLKEREGEIETASATGKSNDALRSEFAAAANAHDAWLNTQLEAVAKVSGDAKSQIAKLNELASTKNSKDGELKKLQELYQKMIDAQITAEKHTKLSMQDIEVKSNSLSANITKKQKLLESELLKKSSVAGASEAQLAEFASAFKHFDKDKDGFLNPLELKACMSSLGEDVTEDEMGKIVAEYGTDNGIALDKFSEFLSKKHTETDSKDSIIAAFKVLAGDKDFITESELKRAFPADQVEFLLSKMPKKGEDQYDYNGFSATLFA